MVAVSMFFLAKAFLAKNSPVFERMLANDFKEGKEGKTKIKDFNHETISRCYISDTILLTETFLAHSFKLLFTCLFDGELLGR